MTPVEDQTVLVTGATSGLGLAVAHALVNQGAHVLVHGRTSERVDAALEELRSADVESGRAEGAVADLSSLDEVRQLAVLVRESTDRLDALVNNAGIGSVSDQGERREESADGYELRFAVNYLAHYRLTEDLADLLCASAPARVVNVTSAAQTPIDFDDVMLTSAYSGGRAYAQSKLAMAAWTFDLAERLRGTGVTVNCLHPATLMPTKMVRQMGGRTVDDLEEGTAATLRLVTDPQLDGVTGRYFDRQDPARVHEQAEDVDVQMRLRALSERLSAV